MAYVLRRLLEMIPVLLIVVAATFFLAHAVPGGPFDKERPLPAEVKARLATAGQIVAAMNIGVQAGRVSRDGLIKDILPVLRGAAESVAPALI